MTQSTGSQQPSFVASGIGGLPSLQFSASASQTITTGTNFYAPASVFYVARQLGGKSGRILSGYNNNWLMGWHGNAMDQAYFSGWVSAIDTPLTTTDPYLYEAVLTGTNSALYRNGALLYSNGGGTQGPDGLTIGFLGQSEFSDCQISEIMVFNSAVTTEQRQYVERYFMTKYGL